MTADPHAPGGEVRETVRQHLAAFARAWRGGPSAGLAGARALFEHAAGQRGLYRALLVERGSPVVRRDARAQLAALLREL